MLTRFAFVFVIASILPHVEGWWRIPVLVAFVFALYELLWRGVRPDRGAERS